MPITKMPSNSALDDAVEKLSSYRPNDVSGLSPIDPSVLAASDIYIPPEGVPELSPDEQQQRLEQIAGQSRAISVAQANLKLHKEILKAEGLFIETQQVGAENLIKVQDLKTIGVKFEQAQTRTSIEQVKLQGLQQDEASQLESNDIKTNLWEQKLESLRTDVEIASAQLSQKRAKLNEISAIPVIPTAA